MTDSKTFSLISDKTPLSTAKNYATNKFSLCAGLI